MWLPAQAKAKEDLLEEGWLAQSQRLCRGALKRLRRHAQRYKNVGKPSHRVNQIFGLHPHHVSFSTSLYVQTDYVEEKHDYYLIKGSFTLWQRYARFLKWGAFALCVVFDRYLNLAVVLIGSSGPLHTNRTLGLKQFHRLQVQRRLRQHLRAWQALIPAEKHSAKVTKRKALLAWHSSYMERKQAWQKLMKQWILRRALHMMRLALARHQER